MIYLYFTSPLSKGSNILAKLKNDYSQLAPRNKIMHEQQVDPSSLFATHVNSSYSTMREKNRTWHEKCLCTSVSMAQSRQFGYYSPLLNFGTGWHIAREVLGLKLTS